MAPPATGAANRRFRPPARLGSGHGRACVDERVRAAREPQRRGDGAQRPLSEPADGPDPAHARLRQGVERRGGRAPDRLRGQPLPRPVRRLRRVRDRAQPSGGDRGAARGDGGAHRQPAAARRDAARAACWPSSCSRSARTAWRRWCPPTPAPRPSRRRSRSPAPRPGGDACSTPSTPSTGSRSGRCRSTATPSSATASARCWPAATRSASVTSTASRASSPPATWPPSWSSPCRGRASTSPRPTTCPAPRSSAAGRARCSCATRCRRGSGAPGASSRSSTGAFEPDLVCVAKALSGGLVPIGAVLASREVFGRVFDGMERAVRHGSTFGGNDLAAAAALATLRVLERERLVGARRADGCAAARADAAAGRALSRS